MQWILGAVLALQLAQSDAAALTIPLTQETWAGYQFYLLSMGAGTGTFAVSPDGKSWGFSYCATTDCTRDNTAIAMAKCRERVQSDCLIFARGAKIDVKYTIQ